MTKAQEIASVIDKVKTSRRRIMAGVGATALVTSIGVFGGKAKEAQAAAGFGPYCCSLAHNPPNTTYSYCYAHAAYIWYCTYGSAGFHCACCETANNAKSASSCKYN